MNKKETLQAQIDQNQSEIRISQDMLSTIKVDQQKLIDEGERLVKELAELDKPKLRHGDCGIGKRNGDVVISLVPNLSWPNHKETPILMNCEGGWNYADSDYNGIITKLGNIFDDLKAMAAEPLEEFEVECHGSGVVRCESRPGCENKFQFRVGEETASGTVDEFIKIHRNLGRLIATVKAKNG